METPKTLSDFVAADALAKHLGISRAVLLAWRERGLPYIRVGMQVYFLESAVAAWLASQQKVMDTPERTVKSPERQGKS